MKSKYFLESDSKKYFKRETLFKIKIIFRNSFRKRVLKLNQILKSKLFLKECDSKKYFKIENQFFKN